MVCILVRSSRILLLETSGVSWGHVMKMTVLRVVNPDVKYVDICVILALLGPLVLTWNRSLTFCSIVIHPLWFISWNVVVNFIMVL